MWILRDAGNGPVVTSLVTSILISVWVDGTDIKGPFAIKAMETQFCERLLMKNADR